MKNKRVVLINSYCDNQEKINILETNINKIKSNSLDVILLSPIELPTKIITTPTNTRKIPIPRFVKSIV